MRKVNVSIKGVAPLLQHKMGAKTEALLASKTKKRTGQESKDNPEDFLYVVGGKIVQPSEHILQAIIGRLGSYIIQGKGKKSYKGMGQGALMVTPEFIPHKIQTWQPDMRTVVMPSTKGRVPRIRPRFDEWGLDFTIEVINDEMPLEVIKGALDDAGREGGLGDYRPRFGRFIVTKWEEV